MITPQERAQVLYEISMGIGTSLNLKRMLKTAISTMVRKLNCVGAVVYQAESYGNRVSYLSALSIPRNITESESFTKFYKNLIDKTEYSEIKSSSPIIKSEESLTFIVMPIINYGFLVLVKKGDMLDEFIIKSLQPVLLKLSSAIQGCLSNEDLNRKIDFEVKKSREKDMVMFQQARLASIGELIGNISHHWRQPLNTLALLIQDAQDAYEFGDLDDQYFKNFVSESMDKIDLMSKTIDNFRNFFQPNEQNSKFSALESINSSLSLIEEGLKLEKIEVKILVKDEDFQLFGYRNEFSQAILNILNNSKDILIERNIENRIVWIEIDSENRSLYIKDNGKGIIAENIEKIFDPYYTTKHKSIGTGIGLYMTKMIIEENMRGKISAKNSDNGAIFTIKFPSI